MTPIEKKLEDLYKDLAKVQVMSEEVARSTYNADSKREYISILNEEIDSLENQLDEIESYENRCVNYAATADQPYLCW